MSANKLFCIALYLALLVPFKHVIFINFPGIPTDEEQATGLEKIILTAMKEGAVRRFITCSRFLSNFIAGFHPVT